MIFSGYLSTLIFGGNVYYFCLQLDKGIALWFNMIRAAHRTEDAD